MNLRRGDNVVVIGGKEKGKRGKVLRLLSKKNRVVIERICMVKRHTRPTQANPRGGVIEKEGSVALSNVSLWCGKCSAARRARAEMKEGQAKRRACIKCGTIFEAA
jgi:large subunit ribosomal protein L24